MSSHDDLLSLGDFVEHRMNTNVVGMVIGIEGSLLHVRLSPTLVVAKFHEFELRLAEDEEYHEPPAKEADASNVIDFTKAVDLRRAKAKGAA